MSHSAPTDAPPAPAASAEEPPPQDDWPGGLAPLRAELDRIDDAVHGLGVVHLEGVVQGERVDVDDAGLEADVGEQGQLVLDQLALGGD